MQTLNYMDYLLRLNELELATRASNSLKSWIRQAGFVIQKDLDSFDFTVASGLSKSKVLKLARCGWNDTQQNYVLVGA